MQADLMITGPRTNRAILSLIGIRNRTIKMEQQKQNNRNGEKMKSEFERLARDLIVMCFSVLFMKQPLL